VAAGALAALAGILTARKDAERVPWLPCGSLRNPPAVRPPPGEEEWGARRTGRRITHSAELGDAIPARPAQGRALFDHRRHHPLVCALGLAHR